jgi:predicted aspartyl protease
MAAAGALLLASSGPTFGTGDDQPSTPAAQDAAGENGDLQAVRKAMQSADSETLTGLYRNSPDPIVHVWSAMALERVNFNLDAASTDARACESALFDTHPGIALSCGQFRVGNLQLAGRVDDAREAERQLIARFRGHGVEQRLDDMQAYLDGVAGAPALSYDLPGDDVTLKLQPNPKAKPPREAESTVPRFTVSANGHDVVAMLDTGASDMILGQEDAERLGVTSLDKRGHVNGWLAKNVPTQAGLLDTLKIGDITLHNVPVRIGPRPIVLIGGNLVAPLGTLKITQSTLLIYGKDSPVPACETPMRVSSAVWGNNLRLYPQLLVNDTPQSVMLDTGAHSYLIGTRAALDEVTTLHHIQTRMNDIGGRHAFVNADSAKIRLTIANQPFDITFDVYTDADNAKHPITLGAGALRDMDFLLDFRHQRQCFLLHPNLR